MSAGQSTRAQRQSRVLIVLALLVILALVGTLFPVMRHIAAQRQRAGAKSFEGYVQQNHLGSLVSIDSGTGIDPVSYVLTMPYRIPDNRLQPELTTLMEKYVQYDNGQALSVFYENPQTHHRSPIGLANYDDDTHVLTLTLTPSTGNEKQVTEHVKW